MRRTRYLIAVTLVATALCADRAIAASPEARPEPARLAERLVSRLTRSLGRAVSGVRMLAERRPGRVEVCNRHLPEPLIADARPVAFTPFQFRLPPPGFAAGC